MGIDLDLSFEGLLDLAHHLFPEDIVSSSEFELFYLGEGPTDLGIETGIVGIFPGFPDDELGQGTCTFLALDHQF